ncbi:alpha/beta fold hydrolase [Amycolatopsis regifaucium]|uniref:Hydrolase n=1 Tax=Amycolatopsis regifaucium TaxID=546365 RepID=A0A154M5U0_9PSEU|nr:alpha/beta hydrolase [Amycolatopsis regifaucium]KZB79853.1 hydrolase [Amycolatopsis regifaucium]OKA09830.1 alpha/beta hydrolase [Amycolatopsis regifaucium]SFJ34168.1 Pimeloyl-ACP methyl ester carboxylesterase [Amycolatopsis regifaucium]
MTTTLETVTSADGTLIAFERTGEGTPVILVGGAFNDRTTVAGLATTLAPDCTAIAYDRRGRGDSGAGAVYSVEREVEDLAAVIDHVGGSAAVFGHSSGAVLALEAAARGVPMTRLAVYEPPYIVDDSRPKPASDLFDRVRALIADGDRDDAAELFLTEAAATPAEVVKGMRTDPFWAWFTGLAHTLPYDIALCGPGGALPAGRLAKITAPTLVMDGGESDAWLRAAARAVAETVPGARHVTVEGQDHGVLQQPDALRGLLTEFLR